MPAEQGGRGGAGLTHEQLEELERLYRVSKDPAAPMHEVADAAQALHTTFDEHALWFIAAAANRSTAGFGAEGVDQRGGVPAGWKLVPIEPTDAMLGATDEMYRYPLGSSTAIECADADEVYRVMLAAAPKAPTTPDLAVKELVEAAKAIVPYAVFDEWMNTPERDALAEAKDRLSRALAALGGDNQAEGVG